MFMFNKLFDRSPVETNEVIRNIISDITSVRIKSPYELDENREKMPEYEKIMKRFGVKDVTRMFDRIGPEAYDNRLNAFLSLCAASYIWLYPMKKSESFKVFADLCKAFLASPKSLDRFREVQEEGRQDSGILTPPTPIPQYGEEKLKFDFIARTTETSFSNRYPHFQRKLRRLKIGGSLIDFGAAQGRMLEDLKDLFQIKIGVDSHPVSSDRLEELVGSGIGFVLGNFFDKEFMSKIGTNLIHPITYFF